MHFEDLLPFETLLTYGTHKRQCVGMFWHMKAKLAVASEL